MSTPQIIRTIEELKAIDPETVMTFPDGHIAIASGVLAAEAAGYDKEAALPAVVIATGDQVRAARKALEEQA